MTSIEYFNHGQMGPFGSSLSPNRVMWVCPSMSKPPEVVPNMVFAAKQTQVLNMAQELEAWNLHAEHASPLELDEPRSLQEKATSCEAVPPPLDRPREQLRHR